MIRKWKGESCSWKGMDKHARSTYETTNHATVYVLKAYNSNVPKALESLLMPYLHSQFLAQDTCFLAHLLRTVYMEYSAAAVELFVWNAYARKLYIKRRFQIQYDVTFFGFKFPARIFWNQILCLL